MCDAFMLNISQSPASTSPQRFSSGFHNSSSGSQELPPLAVCHSSESTRVNDADQQLAAIQREATISIAADLLTLTNAHIQTINRQAYLRRRGKGLGGKAA